MKNAITIKGYVCRSKKSDSVTIAKGNKAPEKNENGWYYHVPGWFYSIPVRRFKKVFGFSLKPGTHESVDILLSIEKRTKK